MKWWAEWGVVIESEPGYFDLDFSNTRRLCYDGNDLQEAVVCWVCLAIWATRP